MNIWGLTSPSQVRAQAEYNKEHTTRISLKLNLQTGGDIIRWLRAQASMQGEVKRLIWEEIARAGIGTGSASQRDGVSSHPDKGGSADA